MDLGVDDAAMFIGRDRRNFWTGVDSFVVCKPHIMDIYSYFVHIGLYYRTSKNEVYGRQKLRDTEHRMMAHLHYNHVNIRCIQNIINGLQLKCLSSKVDTSRIKAKDMPNERQYISVSDLSIHKDPKA
jgi:hypothetical protein